MEEIIKIINEVKPGIDYTNPNLDLVKDNILNQNDLIALANKLNQIYGIDIDIEDTDMKWFKTPETIYKLVWEKQTT
jgi:hypothetical protein